MRLALCYCAVEDKYLMRYSWFQSNYKIILIFNIFLLVKVDLSEVKAVVGQGHKSVTVTRRLWVRSPLGKDSPFSAGKFCEK